MKNRTEKPHTSIQLLFLLMYQEKSLQSHADVQTRYHGNQMIRDNYADLLLESSHDKLMDLEVHFLNSL